MSRPLVLVAVALVAAASAPFAHADVPTSTAAAVAAWRKAREDGDEAAARAIASATHLDPVEMGASILAARLRETQPAFELGPVPAALRQLRADAGDRGGLGGLDRLIRRLAGADAAGLAREHRLARASDRMGRLDLETDEGRREARRIHAAAQAEGPVQGCLSLWRIQHLLGTALQHGGDVRGAQEAFDRAAAYARAGELSVASARSHFAAGMLAAEAEDTPGAISRGLRSLAAAREAGEPRAIREAVTLLAEAYFHSGDQQTAVRLVAENMPSPAWQSRAERHAYYAMAFNVQSQGNQPAVSLATARVMYENATLLGRPDALGEALHDLGQASHNLGKTADAIRYYEEALTHDLSKIRRVERLIRAGLADIWHRLGRYEDAEKAARSALAISRALGRKDDEAQDLLRLAQALAGQGRWQDSLRFARTSLALAAETASLPRVGEASREVAVLHWRAGEQDRAFALLEKSRAAFAECADAKGEAYTLWLMGAYRVLRREHAAALEMAERSGALLHPSHSFYARIIRLRAAALYGLGRFEESAAAARAAIERRRRVLEGLAASDSLAMQRAIASAAGYGVRSAQRLAAQATGEGAGRWADEAFWMVESSRAMQLNTALREVRAQSLARLPPDLVRAERASQEAVSGAHARLVEAATRSPAADGALAAAERAVDEAWKDRDRIVARIERVSRRAAAAAGARPIARADFAALLRPDEAWIAWTVARDRVLAVCVRASERHVLDVGATSEIESAIESWRRTLATPGAEDAPTARTLHAALIAPLRPHLEGVRRLIVSPGGALASVPLAALVVAPAPGTTRLLEEFEVLYAPSATSYAILSADLRTARAGQGLVTVAAPAYAGTGLPALPETAREADLVARPFAASRRTRFEGEEAGLDRLLEHLQGVDGSLRALHVAAHAFVDPDRPERNGIVLSGGEMLRVDRVRRLRIHSDLVVLSCCDSARGTPTAGEGQRGLVRAFLVAGAQRVVASCWRVSDAQTPEFMGRLYEAWQGEGMSLPGALRAAQLERLQAGGKLAHPYYWAAFVAWGLP